MTIVSKNIVLKNYIPIGIPKINDFNIRDVQINLDQDQQRLGDIPQDVEVGEVFIKVKENARNYINKGKTEKITFDNKSFKVASQDANRSFLNSKFFVYKLESTK